MTQQVHYWLYTPPNKQTNKQTKKKHKKTKNTSSKGYMHYSVHIIIIYQNPSIILQSILYLSATAPPALPLKRISLPHAYAPEDAQ